jgi:hypothetical protein
MGDIVMLNVKVGDLVVRYLSSDLIEQQLRVTRVDDSRIYCGPYTFSRRNGVEIDEDPGGRRDEVFARSASFIRLPGQPPSGKIGEVQNRTAVE